MESIQEVWNDLRNRMRELPKRTQILTAIGAILCFATLILLNQGGPHDSEIELLPDALSTRQLSAYQIAFADAGLADYRIEKQKILVPKVKKSNFMAALSKANLLTAASGKYLEKAIDSSSPFENQQQRKQRIKIAREKEFAQTISQFNGIEEATVQYDAKEKKGISQEVVFTASVTVRAKNEKPLSVQQSRVIKNYLAGCIAGLEPDAIYIVDLNPVPETHVPTSSPEHFSQVHGAIVDRGLAGEGARHTLSKLKQGPDSIAAGTLAIVGTALIAGCVALLRRRNSPPDADKACHPDPAMLDIEIPNQALNQPLDKNQPTLSDVSIRDGDFSDQMNDKKDHTTKARLLLDGQSDYSHLIPNQQTDGIELTTLAVHSNSETAQGTSTDAENGSQQPFEFVQHANPEELFQVLINEEAQVIAIVFSHLPSEQSADLLRRLPDDMQVQVLKHFGDLSLMNNASTEKMGKTIAKRLASIIKQNAKRKAGMQAVGDLLNFVDIEKRTKLLEALQLQDEDLASHASDRTKPITQSLTEENSTANSQQPRANPETEAAKTPKIILQLSGIQLCELFAAVDPRDAVLALSHWDAAVTQTLTTSMQSEDILRLEKSLRTAGGQKIDKSSSCRKVLATAKRLVASGQFAISQATITED
ncbi:MAG: hypothetical protein VX970_00480 [Planctomycetota bacterium]|nr:hypothetical protein [Planctomycetota bacterium]